MIKFSVVIPTYNRANCIGRCIESVLKQTCQNFEIIIVDNYSEDNTLQIVNSYCDHRIRIFQIHNNGVIALSRNKGIIEAQGEWICFLDSDDWWHKNKLRECEKITNTSDVIYHKMYVATSKGLKFRTIGKQCSQDVFTQILESGNIICNSSVCCKKNALIKIGLLSENSNFVGVEDCDCWLKLSLNKYHFNFIASPLGYYWIGENASISLNQLQKERNIVEKYINNIPLTKRLKVKKNLLYREARIYHKIGKFKDALTCYIDAISISNWPRIFKIMVLSSAAIFNKRI